MRIVVNIANADPPQGHLVHRDGVDPTPFVGWLGLIRVMADAVADEQTHDEREPSAGAAPG